MSTAPWAKPPLLAGQRHSSVRPPSSSPHAPACDDHALTLAAVAAVADHGGRDGGRRSGALDGGPPPALAASQSGCSTTSEPGLTSLTPQTPGMREFEPERAAGCDAAAEHFSRRVHLPLGQLRPRSPLALPGGSPVLRASSPLLHDIRRARETTIETIRSYSSILGRALSPRLPPYTLVWSDEFDYEGPPDPAKWGYQVQANRWTRRPENAEAQWYTTDEGNARVSGGTLKITARHEERSGCQYTSARLFTKGKGDWKYGRVEVCAKLPAACRGVWPAIWMLPTDQAYGPWPKSGEIDLMENAGFQAGELRSSVHTGRFNHRDKSHVHGSVFRPNAHCEFHVYTLEWSPTKIATFVDNHCTVSFYRKDEGGAPDPMAWPFDQRFFLVLNVAVGGNWAGQHGIDNSQFPSTLEIGYVRVYQRPHNDRASPPPAWVVGVAGRRADQDEQRSLSPARSATS